MNQETMIGEAGRGLGAAPGSANAWYLLSPTCLTVWDRIRLLLGWKLFVRFDAPSGQCSAACKNSWAISRAKYVSQDMDWRWGNNWPNNAVPSVPLSRLVRDLSGPTRRELIYKECLDKLKRKHGQERFDMAGKVAGHTPNDIEWWLEVATPNYLKKQYAEILSNRYYDKGDLS